MVWLQSKATFYSKIVNWRYLMINTANHYINTTGTISRYL